MPSMHQAFVPGFVQTLRALSGILDKAGEHARATGIDQAEFISARLAPDMLPFSRQVQLATDHAVGPAARLSGREIPKYEDNESTFDELKIRIAKTIDFVASVPNSQIDGTEEKKITFSIGANQLSFTGTQYLAHFAIPNFYFHVTTAYGILRHSGVEIGKRDFIGTS